MTTTLKRVFKLGNLELPDLDDSMTPEQVVALHVRAYPTFKDAEVAAPIVDGDKYVYEILKPKVGTKG